MATVDLGTEAKQILDKLSDENLGVVISLLSSLKDRECPKRTDLCQTKILRGITS